MPIGIAAIAVSLVLIGIHLMTLSQQVSAGTNGGIVYNPRTGVYTDLSGTGPEGEALRHNAFSSGAVCPIHQLGWFGTSTSRK